MTDKDPKRWQEVIIDSPFARLTKQDVHDYFRTPAIQQALLAAAGTREAIVRQSFSPDRAVLRRKDEKGHFIHLTPERLRAWNEKRLTEVHPTFGKKVDTLLVDIDPKEGVPWTRTKQITETVAKALQSHPDVQDVSLQFSGNRGFYVRGRLSDQIGVDRARHLTKRILGNLAQRPDVSFGTDAPIRLDTTPLKVRGSVRAPFSLDARTGLVSAPVDLKDIGKVEKKDFSIDRVLSGIKKAAHVLVTGQPGSGPRYDTKLPAELSGALSELREKVSALGVEAVRNTALRADLERALKTYETVEDTAHGRPHIENVIRTAHKLNELFGLPVDRVTAAAVLHDIGNPVDRKRHAEIGAEMAPQYLQALPPLSQAAVIHAIREHRYTKGNPRSQLAKMINDADTLSDFMAENDPNYFFRRLVAYRKAKGMPQEEVYEEARGYGRPWLRKALHGGLRTPEALEQFRPQLESALRQTANSTKFREFLRPIVEEEYRKKVGALATRPRIKEAEATVSGDVRDDTSASRVNWDDPLIEDSKGSNTLPTGLRYVGPTQWNSLESIQSGVNRKGPAPQEDPMVMIGLQGLPKGDVPKKYGALANKLRNEFAPGIPASKKIHTLPTVKKPQTEWMLAIQEHKAHKAGKHFDLRLVQPLTDRAHSWALPKARLPEKNDKMLLAVQQPTHKRDYALHFTGTLPAGYGAGTVTMPIKEKVKMLKMTPDRVKFERHSGEIFNMFRTKGNKWGIKRAEEQREEAPWYLDPNTLKLLTVAGATKFLRENILDSGE